VPTCQNMHWNLIGLSVKWKHAYASCLVISITAIHKTRKDGGEWEKRKCKGHQAEPWSSGIYCRWSLVTCLGYAWLFGNSFCNLFGSTDSNIEMVVVTTTTLPSPPALTTTFTPPLSCLQNYYVTKNGDILLGPSPAASECYPSGWNTNPGLFFSPGLFCPSAYVTAYIMHETIMPATETRVTCCPTYETLF
jgi:hypothetical protein